MRITYFQETDTLLVEFSDGESSDTRELGENTLGDNDYKDNLLSLTIGRASNRVELDSFSYDTERAVVLS